MPVPLIHQTDLYKPPHDPDDHWDLACVFALARMEHVDLRGIIIDYPPRTGWDPDLIAIAQMNRLAGLHVPCVVGSPVALRRRDDMQRDLPANDARAADFLLNQLDASADPVVITVGGSCRDVAIAAARAPDLFRIKCRAVYLNAGYGARNWKDSWEIEYNVRLDPLAYASVLTLPCRVYWLPCFEDDGRGTIREYGTFWSFRQREILEELSPALRSLLSQRRVR